MVRPTNPHNPAPSARRTRIVPGLMALSCASVRGTATLLSSTCPANERNSTQFHVNPCEIVSDKTLKYKGLLCSMDIYVKVIWSGRRDSNSRLQPWQGCALPLSYARIRCDVGYTQFGGMRKGIYAQFSRPEGISRDWCKGGVTSCQIGNLTVTPD